MTVQALTGVLLIHGLNGNPSDLAEMASVLQTQGMVTTTMHLPGHGEQGCEMRPVRWQEWVRADKRLKPPDMPRCRSIPLPRRPSSFGV